MWVSFLFFRPNVSDYGGFKMIRTSMSLADNKMQASGLADNKLQAKEEV